MQNQQIKKINKKHIKINIFCQHNFVLFNFISFVCRLTCLVMIVVTKSKLNLVWQPLACILIFVLFLVFLLKIQLDKIIRMLCNGNIFEKSNQNHFYLTVLFVVFTTFSPFWSDVNL